jgi:hypothetical protein
MGGEDASTTARRAYTGALRIRISEIFGTCQPRPVAAADSPSRNGL